MQRIPDLEAGVGEGDVCFLATRVTNTTRNSARYVPYDACSFLFRLHLRAPSYGSLGSPCQRAGVAVLLRVNVVNSDIGSNSICKRYIHVDTQYQSTLHVLHTIVRTDTVGSYHLHLHGWMTYPGQVGPPSFVT
jgi:hypothetical protein